MPLFSRKRPSERGPVDFAGLWAYLQSTPLATFFVTSNGTIQVANAAAGQLLGTAQAALTGSTLLEHVHTTDRRQHQNHWSRLVTSAGEGPQDANEVTSRWQERWLRADGAVIECDVVGFLVPGGTEEQLTAVLTLDDVTTANRLEQSQREADQAIRTLRAAGDVTAVGDSGTDLLPMLVERLGEAGDWGLGLVWIPHQDGKLRCSHAWHCGTMPGQIALDGLAHLTLPRGQGLPGRVWEQDTPNWVEDFALVERSTHAAKADSAGLRSAVCVPVHSGDSVHALLEFLSWDQRACNQTIMNTMATAAKQAGQALARIALDQPVRDELTRYCQLADAAHEAILIIDSKSKIQFANQAVLGVFGYQISEVIGRPLTMLMDESLRQAHSAAMAAYVQTGRRRIKWDDLEFNGLTRDGQSVALQISLLELGQGERTAFAGFIRDVTEQKKESSALIHQALHDGLTDLPNRELLQERIDRTVLVSRRHNLEFSLMFMDLDRFKDVNDSFGHRAGDLLLKHVAARLQHTLRESDTVARLGGDEYGMLLPSTNEEGAIISAQRILDALAPPFEIQGKAFNISASIGIALYPRQGDDSMTLMRQADIAMYAAKRRSSGYAIYSEHRDEATARRLLLLNEIRGAIADKQLVLHYQPKVSLGTGRTEQVEALVRWQHPVRGLIPPGEFIPQVEETDLIKDLTKWVLHEAIRQHGVWKAAGIHLRIAVNFSARVLHDPLLLETVKYALDEYGAGPDALEVEITESSIMVDPDGARATLTSLHTAGIWTAIDDFGTGHSSLAYLRRLPFDEIKIDKSFVQDMATSRDDASIVRSVVALGHNFELKVVAEGVDNQRTLDMLGAIDCDLAQGYFLSKPIPAERILGWIEGQRTSRLPFSRPQDVPSAAS